MSDDDEAPAPTVRVFARANLTLEGGIRIDVYDVVTVPNTPEVRTLIAMEHLVAENPDGTFADLGPIDRMPLKMTGCCGNKPGR